MLFEKIKQIFRQQKEQEPFEKHDPLIVSFTSHPARIKFVPQVLESLYAQTLQADRILLWLAEEQFPDKENDLPEELKKDLAAGKLELHWCDEIGSHKKYFYAMQEFPEDIIITVDDDMIYHPDTIRELYKSYLHFPEAVSAIQTSLILFDGEGSIMSPKQWLYDFRQLHEPSLQLLAIGAGGILYPPGCLDKRVFDKETILKYLRIEDTYTSDDEWLKIHELLAETPTVTASDSILVNHIPGTESTALAKKSLYGTHSNTHFEIIKEHYAMISKDELEKRFQACMHESCFIPDDSRLCYELCTADLEQKIAVLTSKRFFGDPIEKVLPVQVRKVVTMFNRQMARDHAAGGEKKYVSRIRKALRKVPGIDAIAWKDITIQALIEHEAVLRVNMWGAFNTYEDYKQMLRNWQHLLESHPNCRPVYHEKYKLFLEDMEKAFPCKHEI